MPHSLKSFNGFIFIVALFHKARIKKLMREFTKKKKKTNFYVVH